MGQHTEEVSLAWQPPGHIQFTLYVQNGYFPPRTKTQLDGWSFLIISRRINFHFLCSHLKKNHLKKYLFHFHDICFLLCRDISLAVKAFFLNRSKCQVWISQGTAKRFAWNCRTQANLATFREERWVKIVLAIIEFGNTGKGSAVKCSLYKGN